MAATSTKSDNNLAALIHLSTFTKYIIPLGNFLFPLIIWSTRKEDRLIDEHGRQAINFQISIFLYMVFIAFAGIASIILIGLGMGLQDELVSTHDFLVTDLARSLPILITVLILGVLLLGLFLLELFCVITATVRASEGTYYYYPLTIPFIKSSNQSNNEQFENPQKETL